MLVEDAGPRPVELPSRSMREVHERLVRVASSPLTPVFLCGASGVGKRFAARVLHALTFRDSADRALLIEIDCASEPDAFADRDRSKAGGRSLLRGRWSRSRGPVFEPGGTILLRDAAKLSPSSQDRLMAFLDDDRFRDFGEAHGEAPPLRIVATAGLDPAALVETGALPESFYHRLAVITIPIPDLASRLDDIPVLSDRFAQFFSTRLNNRPIRLARSALERLASHSYSGNVRELRNIIERAIVLSRGDQLTASDIQLPKKRRSGALSQNWIPIPERGDGAPATLKEVDRAYLQLVLDHFQGVRTLAAKALGISYPTFLRLFRDASGEPGR